MGAVLHVTTHIIQKKSLKICIPINADRFSRVSILSGAPFTVAVIGVPQRFQAVNPSSPLQTDVRFLPFALSSPFDFLAFRIENFVPVSLESWSQNTTSLLSLSL